MIEWSTILSILCFVLLAFILWREWLRQNKSLLWARLISSIVAVVCLYFLALPPTYTRKSERVEKGLVLITEGAIRDSFSTQGFEKMPAYDISKVGIEEILENHKTVNTIHVFGFGLEPGQLKKLSGQNLVFHPSTEPEGFSQIQYRNELVQGEMMELQGRFLRRDSMKTTVKLMSFGEALDSVPANDDGFFTLRYLPAHLGVASFSLMAVRGSDTLEKQILPVNITVQQPLRVLILSSAPGFESRFLKDWLSEKGYGVVSKTRMSKNIYAKDFVNEKREQLEVIRPGLLDLTDIIVADNGALASLSANERRFIHQAVREKGMGLLICVAGEESTKDYQLKRMPGGVQQKLNLELDESVLSALSTEDQYDIVKQDLLLPLIADKSGRIFSAASVEGQGRIVLNTINYSYKWKLSGLNADYDQFWMKLISSALGGTTQETWDLEQGWPVINDPLTVAVTTEQDEPVGDISGIKFYLQNDPQNSRRWQGVYWPRVPGWYNLRKTDGTEQAFFVYDRNAWKTLRIHERIKVTREYIVMQNQVSAGESHQELREKKEIPPILFLLLFMISTGFLWFEQKRMSGN